MRTFVLAIIFTLITPIGIAIGIAVRHSFSQNGKAALLSVGILNSISAGILVSCGVVERETGLRFKPKLKLTVPSSTLRSSSSLSTLPTAPSSAPRCRPCASRSARSWSA